MKQITEYSEIELKAMAYDQMATIERAQANFKIINEELTKRTVATPAPESTGKARQAVNKME